MSSVNGITCTRDTCTGFMSGNGPWIIDVGPPASSINYSTGPGTASHTPGSDKVTITLAPGEGPVSSAFFVLGYTSISSTSGDPHVKPLDDDDYTL